MNRLAALFAVPTAAALALTALVATPAAAADPITIAAVQGTGDATTLAGRLPSPSRGSSPPTTRRPATTAASISRRRIRRPKVPRAPATASSCSSTRPTPRSSVGDRIQVTGTPGEFQNQTQLSATRRRELHGHRGRPPGSPPPCRCPTPLLGGAREAFEGMLVQPSGELRAVVDARALQLRIALAERRPGGGHAHRGRRRRVGRGHRDRGRQRRPPHPDRRRLQHPGGCRRPRRRAAVLHEEHRRAPRRHPRAAGRRRWCSATASTSGACSRRCR